MTFKDRIRNSKDPITDISNLFREVMIRLDMEVHPGIERVVNNNNYSKIKDYIKAGRPFLNITTAMIVTTAIEIGSKPAAVTDIYNKLLEVIDLDIA